MGFMKSNKAFTLNLGIVGDKGSEQVVAGFLDYNF